MTRRLALAVLVFVTGCSKLLGELGDKSAAADAGPETADANVASAVTANATSTASASAAPVVTATAVAAKAAAVKKDGKTPLAVPSPTTDRFGRDRDKDGPCPAGFSEQPGVENHSTCARVCKTDADCHGHVCEDSMVGDDKVCGEAASTPSAKDAGAKDAAAKDAGGKAAAPKCKANELEDDSGKCLKTCSKDAECPAKTKCGEIRVANPHGGTSSAFVCQ